MLANVRTNGCFRLTELKQPERTERRLAHRSGSGSGSGSGSACSFAIEDTDMLRSFLCTRMNTVLFFVLFGRHTNEVSSSELAKSGHLCEGWSERRIMNGYKLAFH